MEMEPVDTDHEWLEPLKSATQGWIASADSKAAAMLTASAVLLAFIGAAGIGPKANSIQLGLFVAFAALIIAHVCCLLAVLWPRTSRAALGDRDARKRSLTFFGDIAKISFNNFLSETHTPAERRADLRRQVYMLARIADRKMRYYRAALALFVPALLCFVAVVMAGWLAPTTAGP